MIHLRCICLALLLPVLSLSATPAHDRLYSNEDLQLFIPGNESSEQAARAYASQQLERLVRDLATEDRLGRRSTHKAIQLIQSRIGRRYLRHRQAGAEFSDLFRTGHFSPATATALYALVLEHFKLPYQVTVSSGQITLTADPAGRRIALTPGGSPTTALRQQAYVQDYLRLLRQLDLPTPAEWSLPAEQLYERYTWSQRSSFTLPELAAYLHYQQATVAYHQRRYTVALRYLAHADGVATHPAIEVLRRAALYQLANGAADSRESLYYLFELWREQPRAALQQEVLRRFVQVADQSLFQRNEPSRLDSLYQYMQKKLSDGDPLQGQLGELYYLKLTRYYALQRNGAAVRRYLDSLYRYRPDDPAIRELLKGMLAWSLHDRGDYQAGLQQLADWERRYPFLLESEELRDLALSLRAERIRATYDGEFGQQGAVYLQEFETTLARYGRTPRHRHWVLTTYIAASSYHYRRQEFTQARQLLERAWVLVPGNAYLDHQITMLRYHYE